MIEKSYFLVYVAGIKHGEKDLFDTAISSRVQNAVTEFFNPITAFYVMFFFYLFQKIAHIFHIHIIQLWMIWYCQELLFVTHIYIIVIQSLIPLISPNAAISKIITPIILLTSHILLTLNLERILFTKNVIINHHNRAPTNIKKKPIK